METRIIQVVCRLFFLPIILSLLEVPEVMGGWCWLATVEAWNRLGGVHISVKNCNVVRILFSNLQVNFNEPISMLQRLTEELEYAHLLDRAAACESSTEQMCYVAAFTVSSYSTTATRVGKPFNPLLGETFEFDRTEDLGWRSLAEQVKVLV